MTATASRKIGKYEILHKLGRGGMADVYLALVGQGAYRTEDGAVWPPLVPTPRFRPGAGREARVTGKRWYA
jgi:hypothetical protein